MNLRNLVKRMVFLNEVESKRQTYYICKAGRQYMLMTFKEDGRSGNFSIIDEDSVDYIYSKTSGKANLTIEKIKKLSKKPNVTSKHFDPHKIMYVLAAQGKAKIDNRFKDKALHFNVR